MTNETLATKTLGAWPEARALKLTAPFWLMMYAASAFGTNLGDFWADALSLGLATSFVTLGVISAALILVDRRLGRSTDSFFWLAIIFLRAMATNVGDFLTDDLGMSRLVSTPLLAVLTLAAGAFTIGAVSPRVDSRYWAAMFLGGAFGTVGGDLVSHAIGLPLATVSLAALLVVAILVRGVVAPSVTLGYWVIVLAERAAGTPAGDLFAEDRGLNLGLPIAMTITGGVFILAFALKTWRDRVAVS